MQKFFGGALLVSSMLLLPFASAQDLPEGAGRDTLKRVCTQCHDIDSVPRLRYSRADWASLVYSMKDMGADATSAELDEIIDYLVKNFGKDESAAAKTEVKKVNVNKASAQELADGLGFTPKEAGLIVDFRTKNGDFKDAYALFKVDGVDTGRIQDAKDKMEF
jgi:competence ComEA-like helix-hairpin-helix protein